MNTNTGKKLDDYLSRGFGVCLLLVAWFLYFPNTAVSPQNSISAELATAAIKHELVYPPRSPLYSLLSWCFVDFLQLNPIANLSIMSAVFQSLSVFILFFICSSLLRNSILSFAIAALWMIYIPVMNSATIVGTTSLFNFISCCLLYFSFAAKNKKFVSSYDSLFLGLLFGLGLSVNIAILIWAPFLLCLHIEVLESLESKEKLDRLGAFVCGLGLGLLPYCLLFIKTSTSLNLAHAPLTSISELLLYLFPLGLSGSTAGSYSLKTFLDTMISEAPFFLLGWPLLLLFYFKKREFSVLGLLSSAVLAGLYAYFLFVSGDPDTYKMQILNFCNPLSLYAVITFVVAISLILDSQIMKTAISVILLLPTVYLVPLALAATNARNDHVLLAETQAILNEVPEGAVFISYYDRSSSMIRYLEQTNNQSKSLILINERFLDNPNYVSKLQHKFEIFNNLDLAGKLKVEEILGIAIRARLPVYSHFGVVVPENYVDLPVGVSVQWVSKSMPVLYRDIVERLVAFCSRWPDVLAFTNFSRIESEELKQTAFLRPIENHLNHFGDSPLAPPLHSAIKQFQLARIDKARNICSSALAKISTNTSYKPGPYLPRY